MRKEYYAALVRLVLSVVIVISTTGCVPFPHRVNTTPWVAGRLESAGTPLPDYNVRVVAVDTASEACEGPSVQVTTNEFGKFAMPPARRMGWMLVMMAHQRFHWNLCVEIERRWISAKRYSLYTLGDTGPQGMYEVRCSITPDDALATSCKDAYTLWWDYTRSQIDQWLQEPAVDGT
jgi:hypothetical protein